LLEREGMGSENHAENFLKKKKKTHLKFIANSELEHGLPT